jgi:Protein of unknown function (DUF1353)
MRIPTLPTAARTLAFLLATNVSIYAGPLPDPLPCTSCFIGTLALSDNPADPTGQTKILSDDLYFVDPAHFVWKSGKGDITDGASIPPLFQPIIGGPWESSYLPAAVMHDHYTNIAHKVRPWRDTDLMFYQAMLVNHTDVIKAKLMYYAVYAFGPHWDRIAKGVPCGENCVFEVKTNFLYQSSDYELAHVDELKEVQSKIAEAELRGEPMTLSQLDELATTKHSLNVFLTTDTSR